MMNMYKLLGALAITAVLGSEINGQTSYTWSPAGPVLSAGRSRNMIVDRNNNDVHYVGSVSSGIFKSTNAGATWSPVNDQDLVRNISYLAQDANGVIWAATGEGFLRATARSRAVVGSGLYKLVGNNLSQMQNASVTGSVITRVACHLTDATKLAIAGSNGLLVSTDGGSNFTKATGDIPATATAQTVYYDNAGNIYATATDDPTGGGVKLYKSINGDPATFSAVNTLTSSNLPNSNYGRIELGIANSNNNTIYASIARPTNPNLNISSASLFAFFVSKDAGLTWTMILEGSPQLDPLSSGGSSNSGDYAHCVVVNPLDENQVFVGSYKFYAWTKTTGGPEGIGTWLRYGSETAFGSPFYLRQNIHDVKITTSGSSLKAFYFITDAGIYKSTDMFKVPQPLTSFQPFFNGLGTAQYNSIDINRYPKSGKTGNTLSPYSGFIAATAGNGISYFSGNYPLVTNELNYLNDDFFNAVYSKNSPNTAYFTSSNGNIWISSDVTANDPNQMQATHLGSQCSSAPSITDIDYRGITNGGSTTEDIYVNSSYTATGTPFKLWENTGNIATIDSAIYFNDSIRVLFPVTSSVSSTTSFTVSLIKPQKSAIIDKIKINTFTVSISTTTSTACFGNSTSSYTYNYAAAMEFDGASSATTLPTSYTLTGLTSTAVNTNNKLSVDPVEGKDIVVFELPINPLTAMTNTANYQYVRVGATVFYKYKAGSKIIIKNDNISSYPFKDSVTLSSDLAWTFTNTGTSSLTPISTGAPFKFKMRLNSRFAMLNTKGVLVSKRILNTNDPQKFQVVSCTGALTTNSSTYTAGQMTVNGTPYIVEWAPDGKSVYYVTAVTSPSVNYNVYKVNLGTSIYDFSIEDYKGAYYTGCVTSKRTSPTAFTFTTNFNSKFRTTLIGTFNEKVTNIVVSDNSKSMLVTTQDPTAGGKRVYLSTANIDIDNIDNTVVQFNDKTGNLPAIGVYCGLFEMTDNKRVLLGTDRGIYSTDDITAGTPNWFDAKNNLLPNVQVFDIKQQKLSSWDSYNSGMIYVATNGRGAWMNKNFLTQTVIGVEEHEIIAKNTGLSLYPNPTNGNVTINFFAANNENVVVQVMDLNGRVIKSEAINHLTSGYTDYDFSASDLNNGVYIVNVSSSLGIKRVTKLVVSK